MLQVGGPGTISKSLNSIKFSGWIHTVGFRAPVSSFLSVSPDFRLILNKPRVKEIPTS